MCVYVKIPPRQYLLTLTFLQFILGLHYESEEEYVSDVAKFESTINLVARKIVYWLMEELI